MALSGTLKTLSLSEILQTLERSQAVGVLRLVSVESAKDIVFHQGNIRSVVNNTTGSHVSIAQRMCVSGAIRDQALVDTIHKSAGAYESATTLRAVGIEQSLIDETLERYMLDELYDLFTWEQANFTFLEAGGDQDDAIKDLIHQSQDMSIVIKTNTVLLESARRLDEWERSRKHIPNNNVILSACAGSEQALKDAMNAYPECVIIPHINGQNSLDDIIGLSDATRMDVCLCVASLIEEQSILILSAQQIVAHAQQLEQAAAYAQAAGLYRRALASDPNDSGIRKALASALEKSGDGPQAAGCFAELALGYLHNKNMTQACVAAERALAIGGGHQEHHVLIQCLESAGRIDDAFAAMRKLVEYHFEHSQWDEARDVCHQALATDKKNLSFLHLLSLTSTHVCDFEMQEHEIACVFCDQVNTRHEAECENCSAPLHKSCINCETETACSDRVCLFCGKSPHVLEDEDIDSGLYAHLEAGDSECRMRIQEAVEARKEARYEQALLIWKEISESGSGSNQQIHTYIRELEQEVHNQRIEELISKGNNYRRGRRFKRAIKSYAQALRILAPRDPRKARLESILTASHIEHKRSSIVYGFAGVVLALTLYLILEPLVQYNLYAKRVDIALMNIRNQIRAGGGFQSFLQIQEQIAGLQEAGAKFGEKSENAQIQWLSSEAEAARVVLSLEDLALIEAAVVDSQTKEAQTLLRSFIVHYGSECRHKKIATLRQTVLAMIQEETVLRAQQASSQQQRAHDLAQAPILFAAAREHEKAGELVLGLEQYSALHDSPHKKIRIQAQEKTQALKRALRQLQQGFEDIKTTMLRHITQTNTLLKRHEIAAKQWEMYSTWADLRQQLDALSLQADEQYQQITQAGTEMDVPTKEKHLKNFLQQFPGSRYEQGVRREITNSQREHAAITKMFDRIEDARRTENWAQVYQLCRKAQRNYPEKTQTLQHPLAIESTPSGAAVLLNGTRIGMTPYVHAYKWSDQKDRISLQLQGFEDMDMTLESLRGKWTRTLRLERAIALRVPLRNKALAIYKHEQTLLFCGLQSLLFTDLDGREKARHTVGQLEFLGDNPQKWLSFITVEETGIVVPIGIRLLALFDWEGNKQIEYTLDYDVDSRPLLYQDELFGAADRIGMSHNGLAIGCSDGSVRQTQMNDRVASGPILVEDDFTQLLVCVSQQGDFVAYDESNTTVVWRQESSAADISNLKYIEINQYIAVLDGSRLARFEFSLTGVRKIWDIPMKQSLLAPPYIHDSLIYVSLPHELAIYELNGTHAYTIPVTGKLIAASGTKKDGIAIAEKSGSVSFYTPNGELLWQKQLQGIAQALLVIDKRVYVAINTGELIIFEL